MGEKDRQKVKTLTRADLAEAVYRRVGLSRGESGRLVDDFLGRVVGGILDRGYVKLSSFGVFEVRRRAPRVGRNMKTGEPVPIGERRALFFRPSRKLRERVDKGGGFG